MRSSPSAQTVLDESTLLQSLNLTGVSLAELFGSPTSERQHLARVLSTHHTSAAATWTSILAACLTVQHTIFEKLKINPQSATVGCMLAPLGPALAWLSLSPLTALGVEPSAMQDCTALCPQVHVPPSCNPAPHRLCGVTQLQDLLPAALPLPPGFGAAASTARNEARQYISAWSDVAMTAATSFMLLAPHVAAPCLSVAAGLLRVVSHAHACRLLPGPSRGRAPEVTKPPPSEQFPTTNSSKPPSLLHMAPCWTQGTAAQLQAARGAAATRALLLACEAGDVQHAVCQLQQHYSWIAVDTAVPQSAACSGEFPVSPQHLQRLLGQLRARHVDTADEANGARTKHARTTANEVAMSGSSAEESVSSAALLPCVAHVRALVAAQQPSAAVHFVAECTAHTLASANDVLPIMPLDTPPTAAALRWVHATVGMAVRLLHCLETSLPTQGTAVLHHAGSTLLEQAQSRVHASLVAWEFLLLQCVVCGWAVPSDEAAALTLVQPKALARSSGLQYIIRQLEGWDKAPHAVQQLFTLCSPSHSARSSDEYVLPAAAAPAGTLQWSVQHCMSICVLLERGVGALPGGLGQQLLLLHLLLARSSTAAAGMAQVLASTPLREALFKLLPTGSRVSLESRGLSAARGSKDRHYGIQGDAATAAAGGGATAAGGGATAKQRAKHAAALPQAMNSQSSAYLSALLHSLRSMDGAVQQAVPYAAARGAPLVQLWSGVLMCADSIAAAIKPSCTTQTFLYGQLPDSWRSCMTTARVCRVPSPAAGGREAFSLWHLWAQAAKCQDTAKGSSWIPYWLHLTASCSLQPLVAAGALPRGLHAAVAMTSPSASAFTAQEQFVAWTQFQTAGIRPFVETPCGVSWEGWCAAWRGSTLAVTTADQRLGAQLAIPAGYHGQAAVLLSMCDDAGLSSVSLGAAVLAVEGCMRAAADCAPDGTAPDAMGRLLAQLRSDEVLEGILLHARSAAYERCLAQLAACGADVHGEAAAAVRSAGLQLAAAVVRHSKARQAEQDASADRRSALAVVLS